MEAKITNTTKLTIKDIIIGNFLIHRWLSLFYTLMFAFFLWYNIINWSLLITNFQALIMGMALLLLSGWVGFIWPLLKGLIWYLKLRIKNHTDHQVLDYYFFDINMKIENMTLDLKYKLEYKEVYKVIETKKIMLLIFGGNNYIYIAKDGFKKANDLKKLKEYLARFNLTSK